MKKVLIAFDGTNFSEGAFKLAEKMNERNRILLTGVFLPQVNYANLWSYSGGGRGAAVFIPLVEDRVASSVEKNIDRFKSMCAASNIDYKLHNDFTDFAVQGLKKESRFADLLIISSELFYKDLGDTESKYYLQDILHDTECPVLLVPERFEYPNTNILAYNGSESSVYAIKQFAYLFPELTDNKTLLVYAASDASTEIPDKVYIEELAARHFPDLAITKLDMAAKKFFSTWVHHKQSAVLVSGSFGRSPFSQLFRKSFITEVIRDHQLPVFVTHR
jgi:nucleotide-binding universal stress UspA family protein